MLQLEDNVWDEFVGNDDHIVPYASDEHKDQFTIQGDRCKKQRQGLHVTRSTDNVSNCDGVDKDKLYLSSLTEKETMQEKGSWSHTSKGVFPSCDSESHKELKTLTSDDTRMSDHCFKGSNIDSSCSELCADDTILGDNCVVEDDSVCQFPLNHISQADNELSFLDNDGWLDIGNFEDVDRMFRSCDSTFGMGTLNNEEEFCWLSSSQGTEGADDVLKSEFNFSRAASPLEIISEYDMHSKANTQGLPTNNSNKKASAGAKTLSSQTDVDDDAVPDPLSMSSQSDMKSGTTDDLIPIEKKKLSKSSEGRRKSDYLKNGDTINPYSSLKQYGGVKQPYGSASSKVTSHASVQKQKSNKDSNSLGSLQTHSPLMHPDYSHAQNYTTLLPALSGSRSDHDGHLSPSLKESSYASNMESSHDHSLEAAALKRNEKRDKLYQCLDAQALSRGLKNENMTSPMPFQSSGSAQQEVHQFENENEGHSEVGGVSIIDSSNMQENSSMSSAPDEISLEATSFRQLQQIMDQLDIRTKLCIRDSLYRLAKSAEERHNYANGSIGDDVEACKAMMAQDTSGCAGFMDMETGTNPIDRSIAHLLFHRPSDPSMLPRNDATPFKSNVMIDGCMINPPVMTDKQVFQEEASIEVERKPLGNNTK